MHNMFNNAQDSSTKEQIFEDVLTLDSQGATAHLVIFNDDHNTFDWVIKCLMDIIDHSEIQAEQCAMIIHFKGKATVKTATKNILRPLRIELVDRGLSAVIEEVAL